MTAPHTHRRTSCQDTISMLEDHDFVRVVLPHNLKNQLSTAHTTRLTQPHGPACREQKYRGEAMNLESAMRKPCDHYNPSVISSICFCDLHIFICIMTMPAGGKPIQRFSIPGTRGGGGWGGVGWGRAC